MTDFEKMMAELRREYINSLPQKIRDIETHLSLRDNTVLRDDFHKLKGTGKTYGIPEISELGEAVEKICLKKPDLIPNVVPVAVELLRKIHTARLANQAYSVMSDATFAPILATAQSLQ
jgi:HPt (histidine-containing phosphotransfer) domain-containing protein